MKEPEGFSLDDIYKEMDERKNPNTICLSDKEKEVLIASHKKKISLEFLANNWERWFGRKISRTTLQTRRRKLISSLEAQ